MPEGSGFNNHPFPSSPGPAFALHSLSQAALQRRRNADKASEGLDESSVDGYFQYRTNSNNASPRESNNMADKIPLYESATTDGVVGVGEVENKVKSFVNVSGASAVPNTGFAAAEGVHHGEAVDGSNVREERPTTTNEEHELEEAHMTVRFRHVETEEGHMIITGRKGELARCEDEPIHIPGVVQIFGCLVAVRQDEASGDLVVRQVSENSKDIIGWTPRALFDLKSFTACLTDDSAEDLLEHLDYAKEDGHNLDESGPEILNVVGRTAKGEEWKAWCAIHASPANKELIVMEFELEDDPRAPIPSTPTTEIGPDDIHLESQEEPYEPSADDLAESTTNMAKPLRQLARARRTKGKQGPIEIFNILSQISEQLAAAADLELFLKIVVGVVKELTGFARCMVYQFDEDWNGQVVTELVDRRVTKDLYRGLHFPATDIPKQARELYKINKVRLLVDRDAQTARLVCREQKDLDTPLDMTHAYLRAMSPVHLKYLGNMGVKASMSISIIAFNELWGLISLHTYGKNPARVPFPVRKLCRLLGDTISRNLERLSYAQRLNARRLISTMPTEANPGGYIIAKPEDMLSLFGAEYGVLSIAGEAKMLGSAPSSGEVHAVVQYLRERKFPTIQTSQNIRKDFPDILAGSPSLTSIAGMLYVPLSTEGNDFIIFFRAGQLKYIHWAGNPHEKTMKQGSKDYLEPRKSFKMFTEQVMGKSKEWTDEQAETAAVLQIVYSRFIRVWRQKEAAVKTSKMTNLLLGNASHEVRTPLNAIINYLEIAMEGNIDSDTRDNLKRSHQGAKSLIYVVNDLLDLTKNDSAYEPALRMEAFDLKGAIKDSVRMYKKEATRKGLAWKTEFDERFPEAIIGDDIRLRQIIGNLAENALKYTARGEITIACKTTARDDEQKTANIEISVIDTGCGMSEENVHSVVTDFESTPVGVPGDEGEIKDDEGTGLGLAVVARTVQNFKGSLRVDSELGKGSSFTIALGVTTAVLTDITAPEARLSSPGGSDTSRGPSRRNSDESTFNGSAKSELDRLVDEIQSLGSDNTFPSLNSPKESPRKRDPPKHPAHGPVTGVKIETEGVPPSEESKKSPQRPPALRSRTSHSPPPSRSSVLGGGRRRSSTKSHVKTGSDESASGGPSDLTCLIVEDNPVNMMMLSKRLQKSGMRTLKANNGEEGVTAFTKDRGKISAILMDLQMPICDGRTATRRIREFETQNADGNEGIPIFAVSASVSESEHEELRQVGFSGWIPKPVDYGRLNFILEGCKDKTRREQELYTPGKNIWEHGGWLYLTQVE
ncbi:hypothetical protein YB2330_001642 [Saitoella coloradoensis]